jgi:hypothetical protein
MSARCSGCVSCVLAAASLAGGQTRKELRCTFCTWQLHALSIGGRKPALVHQWPANILLLQCPYCTHLTKY